jgi:hypothetical protein
MYIYPLVIFSFLSLFPSSFLLFPLLSFSFLRCCVFCRQGSEGGFFVDHTSLLVPPLLSEKGRCTRLSSSPLPPPSIPAPVPAHSPNPVAGHVAHAAVQNRREGCLFCRGLQRRGKDLRRPLASHLYFLWHRFVRFPFFSAFVVPIQSDLGCAHQLKKFPCTTPENLNLKGNRVVNEVDALFEIEVPDGAKPALKIKKHVDSFSMWRYVRARAL